MALSEFDLIQRYFQKSTLQNSENCLGIGDDCALLQLQPNQQMAVTVDTMVSGVHFFPDVEPEFLAKKLLAVNLSDLAAMGAEPFAVTLALTLPEINENWLKQFSQAFFEMADVYQVDLIGGDTTSGPLTLTLQAMGRLENNSALKRTGCQPGDSIVVTGSIGAAGLGLKIEQGQYQSITGESLKCFHQPQPRVAEGICLRTRANACIDISDGLAADLNHLLESSQVGATIDWHKIPINSEVQDYIATTADWQHPLISGEDYELCFTICQEQMDTLDFPCTQIGTVETEPGLRIRYQNTTQTLKVKGFEHFS